MANKKIFTTLDMQAGTSLKQPRLHPVSSLPSSADAGQAAVVNGKLYISDATNWHEQYSVSNDATISGELTFNRGASTAPFSLHTNAQGQLVEGLNADKLDGYDARNALNNGNTHSIPRRDNDNLFHVGASSYTESAYDSHGDTQVANKALVAAGIAKLVAQAPEDLDTLKEIAEFMEGTDGAGGLVASIAAKASKAGDTMTGDLLFGDDVKVKFGDSSSPDLQIYHDGFNSYIKDGGTGTLNILSDDVRIYNAAGNKIGAQFLQNGEARLKYNNSTKLATSSAGITVTGTATMSGLTVNGDIANTGNINSGGFLYLKSGGSAYGELGLDGNKPRLRAYGSSGWLNVITVDNNSGKLGLGADATSPSGTLHISTARYGSELFNSSARVFTGSSTYGWVAYGSNSIANVSNTLAITYSNSAFGAYVQLKAASDLTGDLVVGRKYRLTVDAYYTGGSSGAKIQVGLAGSNIDSDVLTTSSATYTITFTADTATGAVVRTSGMGTGNVVTIDNLSLVEDSLASTPSTTADDLVINNGLSQAGLSILGSGGARIHFGESGNSAHSRIIGTYNSDKDSNLFFAASNDGTAATVMTLFGNDKSAKFEGGVGIGGVIAGTDAVLRIRNENDSSYWPLVIENDNGNKTTIFTQSGGGDPELHLRTDGQSTTTVLRANGTSYFNGGSVAIGGTSADILQWGRALTINGSSAVALELSKSNTVYGFFGVQGEPSSHRIDIAAYQNQPMHFRVGTQGGTHALVLNNDGTHDHKSNSIVNSASIAGLQDGACYDFNGTSDYIDVGAGVLAHENITISLWVKPEDKDSPSLQGLVTNGSTSTDRRDLDINSNGFQFTQKLGSSSNQLNSSAAACREGVWQHLVVTSKTSGSDTDVTMYIDGVLESYKTISGVVMTGLADACRIGYLNTTRYFKGQIRDVKIFPSALSSGDIRKLYSGENPKKNTNAPAFSDLNGEEWSGASGGTPPMGWTEGNAGTFSVTAGELTITRNADNPYIYKTFTVTSGDVYKISYRLKNVNASHIRVGLGSTAIGTQLGITDHSSTSYTTYEKIVTATSTTLSVYVQVSTSTAGQNALIDFLRIESFGTLVDFNPLSASSTKWRNEARLGFYDGTVNNATLSQGNTYWNNIKQDGKVVTLNGHYDSNSHASYKVGIKNNDPQDTLHIGDEGLNKHGTIRIAGFNNNEYWRIEPGTNTLGFKDWSGTSLFTLNGSSNTVQINDKLGIGGTADANHDLRIHNTANYGINFTGTNGTIASSNNIILDPTNMVYLRPTSGNYVSIDTGDGLYVTSGKVAIGTTSPANLLHVSGADESMLMLQANTGSTGDKCHIGFGCSTVMLSGTNIGARLTFERRGASTGGDLSFHTRPVGGTLTERLVLRDDGTQDHKGNRTVNSQTLNDSWRSSEPSLRFDGSNDRVSVASNSALDFSGNFTISAWIKLNDYTANTTQAIVHRQNGGIRYYMAWRGNSSDIIQVAINGDGGSNYDINSATNAITDNDWHHIVATIDRGVNNHKIYVDGVQSGSTATGGTTGPINPDAPLMIGSNGDASGSFFDGEIRDVRLHNRALEADEIKGYYNGDSTPFIYSDAAGDVTGTANSDSSQWQGNNSNVGLSLGSGVFTLSNNDAAHGVYLTPSTLGITATVGKRYRISAKLKNGTASGTTVRLQAYPLTGDGLVDHTTTSSFVEVSTEFTATAAFSQIGVWPLSDLNGDSVQFKDFKFEEVGEVAAYTPKTIDAQHSQSAKHKWLDATSNNNHGSISGCTSVGDNDHRGILRVHSNSDAGSAYAHQHLNGTINIGSNNDYQGRIDFNATGGTEFLIDNSYNSNSAKTQFGMKTAGTRLPVLELIGDGSVKATSATSTNLKQVARGFTTTIVQPSGQTFKSFRIDHGLGTQFIHVSVIEDSDKQEIVECAVRTGSWTEGKSYATAGTGVIGVDEMSTGQNANASSKTQYCMVSFATAPAVGTNYKVVVMGI